MIVGPTPKQVEVALQLVTDKNDQQQWGCKPRQSVGPSTAGAIPRGHSVRKPKKYLRFSKIKTVGPGGPHS